MKLKTQLLGFGLIGALLAALVGGIGLVGSHRQGAAMQAGRPPSDREAETRAA